jgi:hypothetical protein
MDPRECRNEADPSFRLKAAPLGMSSTFLNDFNVWGKPAVMPLGNLHNSVLPIIFCDGSRDKTGGKEAGLPA